MDSGETPPPFGAVLSFLSLGKLSSFLRTIAYIDGFNLYFGCLKQVPHCRWLDVEALSRRLIIENNPDVDLVGVKYFTAPIKAHLSPRGLDSVKAQSNYPRALNVYCSKIDIIVGQYFIVSDSYYEDPKPIDLRN